MTKFLSFFLSLTALVGLGLSLGQTAHAQSNDVSGQTVHFNAWGGSDNINDYIIWAGKRLKEEHGINLVHVKLTDTATAVSRVLAEKTVNRTTDGSIDMLWVNGENFANMKKNGLLRNDAWAFDLPSWQYTDAQALPALVMDFGVPTEGLESPWGRAQLVLLMTRQSSIRRRNQRSL